MSTMGMTSQAPAAAMSVSKLMQRHAFESPTEVEKELQQAHASLQSLLTPPYNVSHSTANTPQLPQALLYAILTSPMSAASAYLHHLTALTTITGDGYTPFVAVILRLVNDCYPKLLDQPRTQVLWLLRQLITYNAADIDNLGITLLRQVASGDLSTGNVWLATQLIDVMLSYEQWLYEKPHLFTMALYTYLRLLADHTMGKSQGLNDLKQKEISFCTKVLRERFQDCLMIGRDLIRLLQDVALVPEFELIWRDLLSNPGAFKAPGFTDIGQLYVVRTPTRYLASRVTPDMETQIRFMLTSVRMGSQRRYQTWFAQRYLFTPESETLVCDLIRFICCAIHPTNQILQSDICPRWAIVGWLLKCCKSNHVEANAKLALFYDWLFFTKVDNIMNIEPAMLLTVHSIPKYVDMTHSLLEFLFLLVENYDPIRRDLILKGVTISIDILVGKGVVRSLEPLSASPLVVPALREKLNMYFPSYCKPDTGEGPRQFRAESLLMDGVHGGKGGGMVNYVPAGGDVQSSPGASIVSETTGMSIDELKAGDVGDSANRKRRRTGTSEAVGSEVQVLMDGLTEALSKSEKSAAAALEKLLGSFIAASDQMHSGKLAKVEAPHMSETNYNSGATNHAPDLFSSSSLAVNKFATQIVEIMKKGGYEIFGSLETSPSENLDDDEFSTSLTSTLLNMYFGSNHPQMRQLLVAWHREGLAVGPRLLCYVSRLAKGLKVPRFSAPGLAEVTGDTEVEVSVKLEQDGKIRITSVADEDGGVMSKIGNGGNGSGFGGNHQSNRNLLINDDKFYPKDMALQSSVANAFKSYEEFLRQLSRGNPPSQAGDSNVLANHKPIMPSSTALERQGSLPLESNRAVVDGEIQILDAKTPDELLVRDLETCFMWNMQRLSRVLPSVFRYLPHLATGKVAMILLLVSTVDPADLSNYEYWLTVGEFAVVGRETESLGRLIKASLSWDSIEQQYFWRLIGAEELALYPDTALQVVELSLGVLNPDVNVDAVSGLSLLLRAQAPTVALLSAVLSLPPNFGRFVAIVVTSWMSSHYTLLLSCLQQLSVDNLLKDGRFRKCEAAEKNNVGKSGLIRSEKMSSATMGALLSVFEDLKDGKSAADEKAALRTREIRRALLKVMGCGEVQAVDNLAEKVGENS
ncbi:hypothetical protein KC19_VG203900 [Ceratodon purpureus]|uniref:Uncharacterized protein n=1 Tax=Ceratodon purpureus TaxID=3225 RepID=A0A8T0HS31_CERPU|nr:hypothetical protein KC19_VG203900 [Ceratodon purpureus]